MTVAGFFEFKVTRKLFYVFAAISVLLVGISVASLLYLNYTINRLSDSLYDDIYQNSKLILSADRDLHQAAVALQIAMGPNLTAAEDEQFTKEFIDNNLQAEERISVARSNINAIKNPYSDMKQSGIILSELKNELSSFETTIIKWKNSGYTLITERTKSSWNPDSYSALTLNSQFNEARAHLDQAEDLIGNYALQVTDGFGDKKALCSLFIHSSYLCFS